jgi:IclR family acetate operon transcriptional repressor
MERSGRPGSAHSLVSSVGKAAAILKAFTPDSPALSVRALAARTDIPRSTVHVLCRTLHAAGLLEHSPGHGYQLGPVVLGLGGQLIEQAGLVDAAEGAAAMLLHADGQEMHLGQLVGGWVVYLHRVGRARPVMVNRVGLRAPAHLTGCGKAALAGLSDEEVADRVRAICRDGGPPLPDFDALSEVLATVRGRGYVVSSSFQPGRTSVAAPIVSHDRLVRAGVSVAAPTRLFNGQLLRRAAVDVVECARHISLRLTSVALPAGVRAAVAPWR